MLVFLAVYFLLLLTVPVFFFFSQLNTAVQLILVAASLAAPVFNYVDSIYLQTLW